MAGFGIPSKYEWECPVCGHYLNMGHAHIGDAPTCPVCGHTMVPKVYHQDISPYRTDMKCVKREWTEPTTGMPAEGCFF